MAKVPNANDRKSSFSRKNASFLVTDNEYLYTGRRLDGSTGLQLNRNRFYASHLGRWVNRDPIGYDGGTLNLYEYVGGMPLMMLDPNGTVFTPIFEPLGPRCLICSCEARNGRRTWKVRAKCDRNRRLQECCKDACWQPNIGFGDTTDIELCDAKPSDVCTIWDVCSKSSCVDKCETASIACFSGCALFSGGNAAACGLLCGAAYKACKAKCQKCKLD
ncbi:RHS repeat-associated core domain-containing protein [Adhaeretor mobilis]|uniref:RHS repeat-associated core domain-containing protein n=1 Tax=Adhaeretor mobilis TaxID=1930276 RepID=UPI001C54C158